MDGRRADGDGSGWVGRRRRRLFSFRREICWQSSPSEIFSLYETNDLSNLKKIYARLLITRVLSAPRTRRANPSSACCCLSPASSHLLPLPTLPRRRQNRRRERDGGRLVLARSSDCGRGHVFPWAWRGVAPRVSQTKSVHWGGSNGHLAGVPFGGLPE